MIIDLILTAPTDLKAGAVMNHKASRISKTNYSQYYLEGVNLLGPGASSMSYLKHSYQDTNWRHQLRCIDKVDASIAQSPLRRFARTDGRSHTSHKSEVLIIDSIKVKTGWAKTRDHKQKDNAVGNQAKENGTTSKLI